MVAGSRDGPGLASLEARMKALALGCLVVALAACPESTPPLPVPDGPPAVADGGREAAPVDRPPDRDAPPDAPPDTRPEAGREAGPERPPGDIGPSGLDRSRPVSSLSDAELGRLCDWGLAQLGGYGSTMTCTDGSRISNSPSQQACIQGHDRS